MPIAAIEAEFKTDPFEHQLREWELSAELPARALLWQMRTGKTKLIIDTACHLYKRNLIDAVLVFSQNGVHENWLRRELPIHHWDLEHEALFWRTSEVGSTAPRSHVGEWRDRREHWWHRIKTALANQDLLWLSFNSESMTRKDVRNLIARVHRRRRVLVVFDESQDFRSPGSQRTKMARALANRSAYRRILTGSVVTNSPLAAFSQYELLEKRALGYDTYELFKEAHAEYSEGRTKKGRKYPKLEGYIDIEGLRDRMAPWSSVVLRSDVHDMPDLVRRTRNVILNDEQVRVYRELHDQFLIELGDEEVSIGANAAKLAKLQQVVSGFLIDEFKDVHNIPGANNRLDALADEVYMCPGKAIVWCRFREDIDRVCARLRTDGHEIVEYHGRVSDDNKAKARKLFEPGADNEVKALVGYPTAGLDLSAAAEVMHYSHTFDAIRREQADERATAIGGDNVQLVDFVAPGVDEYVLESLDAKQSMADRISRDGMKQALQNVGI